MAKKNKIKFRDNIPARCFATVSGLFLAVALILGFTNTLIVPVAEQTAADIIDTAMAELFPSAVHWDQTNSPGVNLIDREGGISIFSVNEGLNVHGETVGYAVEIKAQLEHGESIDLMIGIRDDDGMFWLDTSVLRLTKVEILSMSDTVGLATRAQVEAFVTQFENLTSNVTLISVGEPLVNEVLAIPGAVAVSESITNAVNFALSSIRIIVDNEMLSRAQAEEILTEIEQQTEVELEELTGNSYNGYENENEYEPQGGDE